MICESCGKDKKHHAHGLCGRCYNKQYSKSYHKMNRDRQNTARRKYYYTHGGKSMSENKQCSLFLGVNVAEQVLSKVFEDVKRMPDRNPGYDFICNKGKKIDVKSACIYKSKYNKNHWSFNIKQNTSADYFLCIAFDNRKDLNPLHLWLIPGSRVNKRAGIGITESTLSRWDEYKLDISKALACCNSMKSEEREGVD